MTKSDAIKLIILLSLFLLPFILFVQMIFVEFVKAIRDIFLFHEIDINILFAVIGSVVLIVYVILLFFVGFSLALAVLEGGDESG